MWPRPSAGFSAPLASTRLPGHPKWSWWRTAKRIRDGSPPICSHRPSTTRPRSRSSSRTAPRWPKPPRPLSISNSHPCRADRSRPKAGKTTARSCWSSDLAKEAPPLVNALAPEHLELSCAAAEDMLPAIRNAGAIFIGHYTPEAVGDYVAGSNHVLPTTRTARFSSGLGVLDFMKRTSLLKLSRESLAVLGPATMTLAEDRRSRRTSPLCCNPATRGLISTRHASQTATLFAGEVDQNRPRREFDWEQLARSRARAQGCDFRSS